MDAFFTMFRMWILKLGHGFRKCTDLNLTSYDFLHIIYECCSWTSPNFCCNWSSCDQNMRAMSHTMLIANCKINLLHSKRHHLRASPVAFQLPQPLQLRSIQFRGDGHLYPQLCNSLKYTSNQSQVI